MNEVTVRVLIITGIMALFSFAQCTINTRRRNRSKQTLLPFMAAGYGVIGLGTMAYFMKRIAEGFWREIYFLAGTSTFLEIAQLFGLLVALLNLAAFCGYLALKIFGCTLTVLIFRHVRFAYFTDTFYLYDEDYKDWFLREKWVNVREIFKWLVIVGCLLCALVLGINGSPGAGNLRYIYLFPVFVQIVLGEIYSFLNGYTRQEWGHDVVGEDSVSQRVSNFYRVREILERTFPREVLSSTTGCEYAAAQGTIDLLESMKKSEDAYEKIVSDFFRLNETEGVYDTDYIEATLKLIKGENVVFFNPFYRDLGKYLILSFLNTLLTGKKCLILVGRHSVKEDVKEWISQLLREYGKIQSLWRVKDLTVKKPECEVGVLNFSQLYDLQVMEANQKFLRDVGFVFISEPSLIVNTGQVGLSILAQQMTYQGDKPVYCISDRLVDGLVDTMSHLLQTEITEVVAPPVSRNIYTSMSWNADGDFLRQKLFGKQTQYLGNGIELAAVAVKNQIPEVTWFGETKVPVRDIKWIAGQYYPVLCKFMNLPAQQQSIYDKIKFVSNIWSVPEEKEQFVIAEDEFVNIFSTMRTFLSRGTDQTFVNVLSENYLLRDYMRCNPQMLGTNPNAIPSLIPDYAKTERNTLIKLLLTMTYRAVSEQEILEELGLIGIETDDALHTLTVLLEKYARAMDNIFHIQTVEDDGDGDTIVAENMFTVVPEVFEDYFGEILKNARYVCEEERSGNEYLDAKLIGHVTQTILPGQFVTYDGKYYQVKYISARSGVILRRASSLFNGRKYYRQIRDYIFMDSGEETIVSSRVVMDMEVTRFLADFRVATSGYLEMNGNEDLRSARVIDFSQDPKLEVFTRAYHNKAVVRIKLPDSDDKIRFTLCMLISETFRSLFPNAWQYLAVTTVVPEDISGMLNYMIYGLRGQVDGEYLYMIEDSELDLGLLDVVEKNLIPLLELITDYLNWHFEKMREPAYKDPSVHTVEFPKRDKEKEKRRWEKIKSIVRLSDGKKEKDVVIKSVEETEKEKPSKAQREESGRGEEAPKRNPGEAGREKVSEGNPGESGREKVSEGNPGESGSKNAGWFTRKPKGEAIKPVEEAEEPKAIGEVVSQAEEPEAVPEMAVEAVSRAEEPKAETEPEAIGEVVSQAEEPEAAPEMAVEAVSRAEDSEAEPETVAEATAMDEVSGENGEIENSSQNKAVREKAVESRIAEYKESIAPPEEAPERSSKSERPSKPEGRTPESKWSFAESGDWAPEQDEDPDYVAIDGTDIFDTSSNSDTDLYLNDCFAELGITEIEKSRYQEECYLKFGFEDIDERIRIEDVRRFLTVRGFNNNSFTKARSRKTQETMGIDFDAVNHCDFCGVPLSGVSYERLSDGRIQCNECSATAINSVEEFKKLFYQTLHMMENLFGIDYKVPISVRTLDANKIARGFGSVYTPTTGVTSRVVGYAQRDNGMFSLNVENGSPRLATIDTTVHEMTHVWQYSNWNDGAIRRNYPEKWKRDIVYEGMAMWAAIQYLYLIGEVSYAQQQEMLANSREDIYGVGFRLYCERYPLVKDFSLVRLSPFKIFPPI